MEVLGGSPFLFGRERELTFLDGRLRERTPCVLVGESGIGKTAIARAVAAGFGPSFVGGGLSTLAWVPYVPLRVALGRRLQAGDDAHVADETAAQVGDGILVVDDLQWTDPATRRVLELLAGRIRLLLAVRTDDPGADEATALCERLGAASLRIAPLEEEASVALLDSLRGGLQRRQALRLVERAAGNPLFLRELAETGALSASFRLALAARIRRLPAAARDVLALLALLGRAAPGHLFEAAPTATLERAGLVERHGDLLAVRHPLFAEVVADGLDPDARRRLHARAAELLEDVGEAAHHLAAAGRAADAHALALEAAARAELPAERAALLALAASTAADGRARVDLTFEAAGELSRGSESAAAERLLDALPPLAGRDVARDACIRWETRYELGDLPGSRAAVQAGLAAAGDDPELLTELRLAEVSLALLDQRVGSAERLHAAAAGWRLARRHGVRLARAACLHGTALYLAGKPEWTRQLERAVAEARRAGDVHSELTAAYNAVAAHESFRRPDLARALAEEMTGRARDLHLASWERQFRTTIVNLDLHLGNYESVVREGNALLDEGLDPRRRDVAAVAVALALVDLGRFADAAPRIDDVLAAGAADVRGQGLGAWLQAEAELWGGRPRRALEWAEGFLARDDAGVFEGFGRVVEGWARLDLGMPVSPWTGGDDLPPILHGAPLELEGLSRLTAGDAGAAIELLRRAATEFAGAHLRGELRCELGVGIALRAAGEEIAAREALLALEERAAGHGMAPLVGRARRSLRLLGVRRSAPRGRRADGLTVREAEVLELAGAGLTNAAIARRLGIGPSTVKRLVSSGAQKLGAGTRAQAVALYAGR